MATREAERVWPVFVVDPLQLLLHRGAPGRVAWFAANVAALDRALQARGSGLTIRHGPPERVLRQLMRETGAESVYATIDEDPVSIERDRRVADAIDLRLVDDQRILPPGQIRTVEGDAYTVYTPFRRALEARIEAAPDAATARAEPDLERLAPPRRSDPFEVVGAPHPLPEAGEDAATDRLRAFERADLAAYRDERNLPGLDTTSHLSPFLRVGAISIRACWRAARNAAERGRERRDRRLELGATSWRGELAWREFFAHVLAAHPRLARQSYRSAYDSVEWTAGEEADSALAAWRTGRTGYPFVDAGMRELAATGWMHNRARLVTASFLVKDAGVDWRRGEAVYSEHLLDADTQQNTGNWQWVAGVGTDAVPYFRILNPTLQAKKYDPTGAYVRQWVPELAEVPDAFLHEPWRADRPPADYPAPLVDHAEARHRALARYAAVRR